ncbi:YtxH domain-containing protein [Candidatus Microgenomates bacterium]|nr:YtxH domain-containing protein [Candidatus Microgenomates bacterium]
MSDHHHHNNGSGFLNGLLLGALVGAGLVFFLGTKRGKELADEIKEKGLSVFDDFEDVFSEIEEDAPQTVPPATNGNASLGREESPPPPPSYIEALQAHGRRFFHGIPKRK